MGESQRATISVVVPLYNKAPYVERSLRSIRAQTCDAFELVIVDDGSTDGSPDIARTYLRDGDQLIQQANAGPGPARNTGITAASGELIAFLDADDEWMPEFLETMVGLFAKYPAARMAGSRFAHYDKYDNREQPGELVPVAPPFLPEGLDDALLEDFFEASASHGYTLFNSSSVVVAREAFKTVGGFVAERLGEDLDMWGRIALEYPVAYTDRILSCYYRGITGSTRLSHRREAPPLFVETALERLETGQVPEEKQGSLRRYCSLLLCGHAHAQLIEGRRGDARATLRQASQLGPISPRFGKLRWLTLLPTPVYRLLRTGKTGLEKMIGRRIGDGHGGD